MYRKNGVVYKKNSENLWEEFVKDGTQGRTGQAGGSGVGITETTKIATDVVTSKVGVVSADSSGNTVFGGAVLTRGVEISVSDVTTGYDYTKMTQISVRVDGTGDFLTIQEAINSVTDASAGNQYAVKTKSDFTYQMIFMFISTY